MVRFREVVCAVLLTWNLESRTWTWNPESPRSLARTAFIVSTVGVIARGPSTSKVAITACYRAPPRDTIAAAGYNNQRHYRRRHNCYIAMYGCHHSAKKTWKPFDVGGNKRRVNLLPTILIATSCSCRQNVTTS